MARYITFTNQKGGVGKTTSVLNIGAALASKGYRVLLIDLDPQGNLTQSFMTEMPSDTIFTILMKECSLEDVLFQVKENLLLIPCSSKFANFERQFAADADSQYILTDLLEDIEKAYPDQPMGRSILGKTDIIKNISREEVKSFMMNHYNPKKMIISAAGKINHEQFVESIKK